MPRSVGDTELIDDLSRVGDEIGGPPTPDDVNRIGAFDPDAYRRRFGSWNCALIKAGYDGPAANEGVPPEHLLAEIRRLGEELGRRPMAEEMADFGRYCTATVRYHFDCWETAVNRAYDEDFCGDGSVDWRDISTVTVAP
ncbi:hypothetical protein BRD17_08435, partial [Halobacteriales archaeon SW_7_68_16]